MKHSFVLELLRELEAWHDTIESEQVVNCTWIKVACVLQVPFVILDLLNKNMTFQSLSSDENTDTLANCSVVSVAQSPAALF